MEYSRCFAFVQHLMDNNNSVFVKLLKICLLQFQLAIKKKDKISVSVYMGNLWFINKWYGTLILFPARHKCFKWTSSFNPSIVSIPLCAKFNVCSKCNRHTPYMRSNWLRTADNYNEMQVVQNEIESKSKANLLNFCKWVDVIKPL